MPQYYSQHGEDRWIAEHLRLPDRGIFVDVGAEDGVSGSNTLYFEKRGWTGLCIEPNPEVLPLLLRNRRIRSFQCAIGSRADQTFYIHPKKGWSGFDRQGNGTRAIQVAVRRLDDVLDEADISRIDLLSIDVEGAELDVWSTFDHNRYRPAVVIIEYHTEPATPEYRSIMDAFYPLPYRLVHWTVSNLIFERWMESER